MSLTAKEDKFCIEHAKGINASEFLKGGREAGVMQLGLTYDTTTRLVPGVHGGTITGNTLTYNRYVAGKKETVTEALPERISFSA